MNTYYCKNNIQSALMQWGSVCVCVPSISSAVPLRCTISKSRHWDRYPIWPGFSLRGAALRRSLSRCIMSLDRKTHMHFGSLCFVLFFSLCFSSQQSMSCNVDRMHKKKVQGDTEFGNILFLSDCFCLTVINNILFTNSQPKGQCC